MQNFDFPGTLQAVFNVAVIAGAFGLYCCFETVNSIFRKKPKQSS